jgi:hypothetical protein
MRGSVVSATARVLQADTGTRTRDLILTMDALCQLSYVGTTSRDEWIRTTGPLLPKQVRCQTAPHPVQGNQDSNPEPTALEAVVLPLHHSPRRPGGVPRYCTPELC